MAAQLLGVQDTDIVLRDNVSDETIRFETPDIRRKLK